MEVTQIQQMVEALQTLTTAVARSLPAYRVGTSPSDAPANEEERIDVAGAELMALRAYYSAMHASPTPELVAQLEEEIDAFLARS
jgi:hypothetical protein